MSDSFNPYAAAPISPAGGGSQAQQIRQHHLSHEASVKSIAVLFLLGSVFGILASVGWIMSAFNPPGARGAAEFQAVFLTFGVVGLILSIGQFAVALGIRKLAPWSRIPCVVLSVIGLIAFPIGTLVNGYILYLLLSTKGKMVFTPEYKSIIEQTPHMKYKTSIVIWIFVGLIIALLGIGFVAAFAVG